MYDRARRNIREAERIAANASVVTHDELYVDNVVPKRQRFKVRRIATEANLGVLSSGNQMALWGGENLQVLNPKLECNNQVPTGHVCWWNTAITVDDLLITAVGEYDNSASGITTWRAETAEYLDHYSLDAEIFTLAVTNSCIVVAHSKNNITLLSYDPYSGKMKYSSTLRGIYSGGVILYAHNPYFVVSTVEQISVWKLVKTSRSQIRCVCMAMLPIPDPPQAGWVHILDMDEHHLVAARADEMRIYRNDPQEQFTINCVIKFPKRTITCIKLTSSNTALVGLNTESALAVTCLKSGAILQIITTSLSEVSTVAIISDGSLVISASAEPYTIAVGKAKKGTRLAEEAIQYANKHYGKRIAYEKSLSQLQPKRRPIVPVIIVSALTAFGIALLRS